VFWFREPFFYKQWLADGPPAVISLTPPSVRQWVSEVNVWLIAWLVVFIHRLNEPLDEQTVKVGCVVLKFGQTVKVLDIIFPPIDGESPGSVFFQVRSVCTSIQCATAGFKEKKSRKVPIGE
jgi:hypothetical protein